MGKSKYLKNMTIEERREYRNNYYHNNKERFKRKYRNWEERLDKAVRNELGEHYKEESLCKWNYTDEERKAKGERDSTDRWNMSREYNKDIEWLFIGNKSMKELDKILKIKSK